MCCERRVEQSAGSRSAVPPWRDTTMSTDAPGSQQLLLGFTRYFSGAVVRTCRDPHTTLRLFTHNLAYCHTVSKGRPAHLEGHLVFGHVAQDDEALLLRVSGTEAELLSRAAGQDKNNRHDKKDKYCRTGAASQVSVWREKKIWILKIVLSCDAAATSLSLIFN